MTPEQISMLPPEVQALLAKAQAPAQPTPPVGVPEVAGWKPDFNAYRDVGDFGAGGDRAPFFEWADVFKSVLILDSLKHVNGRKGTFYLASFTVVESDNAKYPAGGKFAKGFHYVPAPRFPAEEDKNKRAFRDLGSLAAAANGVGRSQPFDANAGIGDLLTKSAAPGHKSLGLAVRYEQQPYVSKTGKQGIGADFAPV